MINRAMYFIAALSVAILFISVNFCEAADAREDLVTYLKEISSIITNVDITIRSIGFNTLPMKEGVKRMDTYIGQMGAVKYPEVMSKQYRMILLSFKKLRTGLLLFSLEKKDAARELIKNGSRLLKYAAKDILAIAEKEGIRKSGDKPGEKGEAL